MSTCSKMCLHLYQCNLIQIRKRVHMSNNCKDGFDFTLIKNVIYQCQMQTRKTKQFCCIPLSILTAIICHLSTPSASSLTVCAWLMLCISNEEVTYNMIMILSFIITGSMPVWRKEKRRIIKKWVGYVYIFLYKPNNFIDLNNFEGELII